MISAAPPLHLSACGRTRIHSAHSHLSLGPADTVAKSLSKVPLRLLELLRDTWQYHHGHP